MTSQEAIAEVFWTAFKALTREQQDVFIQKLLEDPSLAEDIEDILIAQSRRSESTRPLEDVLKEL